MKLSLQLESEVVAPGGELAGHVLVLEGGGSRSLSVEARFCERSPSYRSVAFSTGALLREGDLAAGEALEFRLPVPETATPAVQGKDGELYWELEAVSDEPGLDTRAATRFDVAPRPAG